MRRLFAALVAALAMVALVASTAFAGSAAKWTVYSYDGDNGPLPIAAANPHRGTIATFAFSATPDQALLTSAASGYVKKGNLLGKAVTTKISITAVSGTTFVGYDTGCSAPPTVRFYFDTQLELGPYNYGVYVSSLWWSNPVSIPLADVFASGASGSTLAVAFDPANWSDTDGHMGNADAEHIAWFNEAASHVNKIGFSFGSGCTFAFGDGSNPAGALFNVLKFSTYTP